MVFCFFKQKSAYELRISDWSSDVCSSDLLGGLHGERLHLAGHHGEALAGLAGARRLDGRVERQQVGLLGDVMDQASGRAHSELQSLMRISYAVFGVTQNEDISHISQHNLTTHHHICSYLIQTQRHATDMVRDIIT